MKRTNTLLAGLILAATVSGAAIAQGYGKAGGCDGMGPMGMGPMAGQGGPVAQRAGMKIDPAQRAERHLGVLKNELKITAEQEPLWQAYADKMKSEAGQGFRAMQQQSADEKLSAPERMAKMETLMQDRLNAMKGVHESFNRLYAGLTPEQKATADRFTAQMGQGRGQGMGQRGGKRGPGAGPGPGAPAPAQKPQG